MELVFGIANARELAPLFQTQRSPYTANDFAERLNRRNREALARLPGYVASQNALSKETDKGQALQRMEAMNTRQARAIRILL